MDSIDSSHGDQKKIELSNQSCVAATTKNGVIDFHPDLKAEYSRDEQAKRTLRRGFERRCELRFPASLDVHIWGRDADGDEFKSEALVRDISSRGALLVDIHQTLQCGDVIALSWNGRTARFKIVWTREMGQKGMSHVAVQRLETDPCPWLEILAKIESDITSNE